MALFTLLDTRSSSPSLIATQPNTQKPPLYSGSDRHPGFECAGISTAAKPFAENADCYRIQTEGIGKGRAFLAAVANPIGGDGASLTGVRIALQGFFDAFRRTDHLVVDRSLQSAMQEANVALLQEARQSPTFAPEVSLIAACLEGRWLTLVIAGGCLAYRIRRNTASLLARMPADVYKPNSTRLPASPAALGINLFLRPAVLQTILAGGDCLLLCAGPVSSALPEAPLPAVMRLSGSLEEFAQSAASLLIRRSNALHMGGLAIRLAETQRP